MFKVNARMLPGGSQADTVECGDAGTVIQQAQIVHWSEKHGLAWLAVAGRTAVFDERAEVGEEAHNGLAVEAPTVHNVRTEGVTGGAEAGDKRILRFIQQDAINWIIGEIAMDFTEEPVAE